MVRLVWQWWKKRKEEKEKKKKKMKEKMSLKSLIDVPKVMLVNHCHKERERVEYMSQAV